MAEGKSGREERQGGEADRDWVRKDQREAEEGKGGKTGVTNRGKKKGRGRKGRGEGKREEKRRGVGGERGKRGSRRKGRGEGRGDTCLLVHA